MDMDYSKYERPELTEEEKADIIEACKMFNIGTNDGEDLSIINPSEEPDILEIFEELEEDADAPEHVFNKASINLTGKSNEIDLGAIMNFQEMRDNAEIRSNLIKDELKFSKTIEYMDLDKLVEVDSSINFFALPNNEEFLDLASSLDLFGVINPLIVTKNKESDKYIVLVGRSRLYALRSLYAETGDTRFFKVPCLILDSSVDPKLVQGLLISTNMKYRKLSKEDQIRSVLILDTILSSSRKTRGEMNVADVIAKQAGISRTTVNNYRELKNLCPTGMDLVMKKHMNLGIARMISHKDQATQDIIINSLGNDINDVKMVARMMEGPSSSLNETWEEKTKRTKEMVPSYTTITVKLSFQEVEGFFKGIAVMRKEYALKYATTKKNSINRFMKVSVNDRDMVQYINRGFLKQETLNKVLAKEFNDVIKLA